MSCGFTCPLDHLVTLPYSEARTPWHQPTLVGFSLDSSPQASKPLIRSYKCSQSDFWPWGNGTGITMGTFLSTQHVLQLLWGLSWGKLGKQQPGWLLSCLLDVNSEDWQTTRAVGLDLFPKKKVLGPLTDMRSLCLCNAGDRVDSPCPTTGSVWHTWVGKLTNQKSRSKCKIVLCISITFL